MTTVEFTLRDDGRSVEIDEGGMTYWFDGGYCGSVSGDPDIRLGDFARLIAAAPELYAALANFIAEADAGHVSVETDKAARAILAKARAGGGQ